MLAAHFGQATSRIGHTAACARCERARARVCNQLLHARRRVRDARALCAHVRLHARVRETSNVVQAGRACAPGGARERRTPWHISYGIFVVDLVGRESVERHAGAAQLAHHRPLRALLLDVPGHLRARRRPHTLVRARVRAIPARACVCVRARACRRASDCLTRALHASHTTMRSGQPCKTAVCDILVMAY